MGTVGWIILIVVIAVIVIGVAVALMGNKRTAAKQIEQNLEKRLDSAVRKNPTRLDLAERFRKLIDDYNAGKFGAVPG